MTKQDLSDTIAAILRDAGYEGLVSTWPRKIRGADLTTVESPSDGAYEYLTGYLEDCARVFQHLETKTITVAWNR